MATFTENYSLIKPDEADYYDVADFNENMDSIDATLAAQESSIGEMNSKMGTAADTGEDTLFGKINQIAENTAGGVKTGFTAIKSLQCVTCTSDSDGSIAIEPVTPENCMVLLQRIRDYSNSSAALAEYTLTETTLVVTCAANVIVQFWIIEFM